MDKKEAKFLKDAENEGRGQLYLDVDRIINEGMAGGTVFRSEDQPNIEEARDLNEEDPPRD